MSLWTPQAVAELERRWLLGESASEIARALPGNRTRAAVIGKAFRAGIAERAAKGVSPAIPLYALRAPQVARAPQIGAGHKFAKGRTQAARLKDAASRRDVYAEAPAGSVRLVGRASTECAWPVGVPVRPAEQMCCGEPVAGRRAPFTQYCSAHATQAKARS